MEEFFEYLATQETKQYCILAVWISRLSDV